MKQITRKLTATLFNGSLCDLIDYLKKEQDLIQLENGENTRVEMLCSEMCDDIVEARGYVSYDVEETEAELKRKSDIEKMENRIRVENEIKALWRLKEKYKDFNGNFEDYKA